MPKDVARVIAAYNDIVVGPEFNSRKDFGDIESLAASIKASGLIQPIIVREGGPAQDGRRKFFLVAGERRYRAIGLLGLKQVEVKLVKGDTQRQATLNLIENLHRKNLDPLEEAAAMQKYMEVYKCNQAKLAEELNVSEPYVSQRLSLLKKATPELKKALETGKVTSTHAREIAGLPASDQKEVVEKIEKKHKETGKAPSTAEVKEEADKRKSANKRAEKPKDRKEAVEVDKEKVKAAKEAYAEVKMTVRSLRELQEQLMLLHEKIERAKTLESKHVIKGQIALLEWVVSARESVG